MKERKIKIRNLIKNLFIVSTPIGNLSDISNRAITTLQEVDIIICENPKHSLKLLNNQGIKKKLLSLHDYNEKLIINKIVKLKNLSKIALISDSGSPLISDPGYKLVKFFLENNYRVTSVPGSSSVINSLQLSGLPINNFVFYGFVPKQESKKKQFFIKIKDIGLTAVIFVSGKNLNSSLKYIFQYLGNREIAVCREMTKIHEQIFRGETNKILNLIKEKSFLLKGEFTLVINGKKIKGPKTINDIIKREIVKLLLKYKLTEVVKIVHNLTNISKKDIYKIAIKLKNE